MMNLTKLAKDYVYQHTFIKKSIDSDIANYSKIARMIIEDNDLKDKDFDALVVALRRLKGKKSLKSTNILPVLSKSSIEIKNKTAVYILEKGTFYKNIMELQKEIKDLKGAIHIVEGTRSITLITSQDHDKIINSYFRNNMIRQQKNLVEIALKSPETMEDTPGVMSYLYGIFAEEQINILETLSCWTDTIFVIEERDLDKAIRILRF